MLNPWDIILHLQEWKKMLKIENVEHPGLSVIAGNECTMSLSILENLGITSLITLNICMPYIQAISFPPTQKKRRENIFALNRKHPNVYKPENE